MARMESTGHPSRVFSVASAAAIGLKVGMLREGPALATFLNECGLSGAEAEAASAQAVRRASVASPDMLVPSAGTLLRAASSLDALRAGLGQAWLANLLHFCAAGVTAGARWIAALPGLPRQQAAVVQHAAADNRVGEGRAPVAAMPPRGPSSPSPGSGISPAAASIPGGSIQFEEVLELTFDDGLQSLDLDDLLAGNPGSDLGLDGATDLEDDLPGGAGPGR